MRPSMGGDLVAGGDHALDQRWVGGGRVDWSFAKVVASDEERGFEVELIKEIKEFASIFVRTVVICESNDIVLNAVVDVISI